MYECTITDTFCSALFSGEHKLTSLYNICKLSEKKIKGNMFKKVIQM